ncbi:MAG: SufE family protein [Pseudomonadota bacterium]
MFSSWDMTQEIPSFDAIIDDFAFIDDWDEKYRYIIDLGRRLPALTDAEHSEENKVRGCASQVWLVFDEVPGQVSFRGDSDAAIVKGLVALMISLFSGKTQAEIAATDAEAKLAEIDLKEHITPQRSNGVASMIKRIKAAAAS